MVDELLVISFLLGVSLNLEDAVKLPFSQMISV